MSNGKLSLRLLRKIGILKHLNIIVKSSVNNRTVFIPIINEIGLSNYLHLSETWMIKLIQKLIQNSIIDGCFVDVGMNIGQTLIKIKAIDPSIDYIGFEPNPNCVNYLNKLIQVNMFSNTKIIPVALSDKTTVTELTLNNLSEIDDTATIIKNLRPLSSVSRTFHIPTFKFSDIESIIPGKIGLLKIDVEGSELEVLSGFNMRVRKDRPLILIEFLPVYKKENSNRINRQNKIYEILQINGYLIYRILKNKGDIYCLQKIDQIEIHSDLDLCDYLLIPDVLDKKLEKILN